MTELLLSWIKSLRDLQRAINDFSKKIENSIRSVTPSSWAQIRKNIGNFERFTQTLDEVENRLKKDYNMFEYDVADVMNILDSIETIHNLTLQTAEIIINPQLMMTVDNMASSPVTSEIKFHVRQIRDTTTKAEDDKKTIYDIDVVPKGSLEYARKNFYKSERGELSTGVFLRKIISNASESTLGILEQLKNFILRGSSPEETKTITTSFHPIQEMGLVFGKYVQVSDDEPIDKVLDLSLSSQFAIVYDVSPLLRMEPDFYATVHTGLNFKLINRLKTIREVPLVKKNKTVDFRKDEQFGGVFGKPLFCTLDCGQTILKLVPNGVTDSWYPLRGPKSRIMDYNRCLEIMQPSRVENDYDKGKSDFEKTFHFSKENLGMKLSKYFEEAAKKRFTSQDPVEYKNWATLMAPVGMDNILSSYICKAVADVFYGIMNLSVLKPVLALSKPKLPYNVVRGEVMASLLLQTGEMSKKISRSIRSIYTTQAFSSTSTLISYFTKYVVPKVLQDNEITVMFGTLKVFSLLQNVDQ